MTMELLERRLRSLERRNTRLKIIVLLVAVFAIGANLTSVSGNLLADTPRPAVQDTVRAHRIEVVDTDGKLLAILGKLTGDTRTTTGLVLYSNEKQVVTLTTTTYSDGLWGGGELEVVSPENEKALLSAGVVRGSHGGPLPLFRLDYRKYMTMMDAGGLAVFVSTSERSSSAAISLRANEDLSAEFMLGGLFKPFKVRAIAEADNPRIEVQKGPENSAELKTFGFAR